jgi:methyl-accepting chemotaxis protein
MEDRVRSLEIANATLAANVEHLSETVKTLASTVNDLNNTMNQGRGALWLMMAVAGGLGAVVVTVAKKVMGIV